jgi:CBS domain-containing protein
MQLTHLLEAKGRSVEAIDAASSVRTAVDLLGRKGIGALVVTTPSDPLAGILSERDVVRALSVEGAGALDAPVSALMTTEVVTCPSTTTVTELMSVMTEQRIRHVPVVDDGELVGIVSIGDVVKSRISELEGDRRDLLDYVGAR